MPAADYARRSACPLRKRGKIELGVDLSTLPFGVIVEGIRVDAGVAHLYGRTVKGG